MFGKRVGSISFAIYTAEDQEWLNQLHTISLSFDSRWSFKTTGIVQPFEKLEHYQAKRVKDRFSARLLEDYCKALGLRVFDGDFFGPAALLIDIRDPLPDDYESITLAEAREQLGLSTDDPVSGASP